MERVDLDVATEFLLIAATLVELKARRLLPGLDDVELDEELLRFEERDLLLARLLECKTFQDAAQVLDTRASPSAARSVAAHAPGPRSRSARSRPTRSSASRSTRSSRRRGAGSRRRSSPRSTPSTSRRSARACATRSRRCSRLLPGVGHDALPRPRGRRRRELEVIVRFLAVLELFKQGVVDLEQVENFGELHRAAARRGRAVALDLTSLDDWDDEPSRRRPTTADDASTRARTVERAWTSATDREARAAIEAVVLAAIEPVPPAVLAQLVELPAARVEELCDELAAEYEREGRGLRARARRRRLPLPDPSRRAPVRRAVRARRPDRALVGPGARDARDRRLQAADRRAAQLSAIRGVNVDATLKTLRRARATSKRSATTRARQPGAVRHHADVPRAARARLARPAAAARRLRARRVGGRGARARAAPAGDRPQRSTIREPSRSRGRAPVRPRRRA